MSDKIKTIYNKSYRGFAPISNGNSYDVYTALEAQKKVDLSNLENTSSANVLGSVNSSINELTKKIVEDHLINEYFLLQLHANYFCGTIEYECDDPKFKSAIQKLIRIAFLYGKACLYLKSENEIGAMFVSNIKTDAFGNIEEIDLGNGDDSLSLKALEKNSSYKPNNLIRLTKKEDIDNCIVFNWGTKGLSA